MREVLAQTARYVAALSKYGVAIAARRDRVNALQHTRGRSRRAPHGSSLGTRQTSSELPVVCYRGVVNDNYRAAGEFAGLFG